jgi:enoyl-CoA hydratase/carnithine racemase
MGRASHTAPGGAIGENPAVLHVHDADRVRRLTLARPEALNAFNEALYAAAAEALRDAARDPGVAVLLVTGTGRAFSAGTDVVEMAALASGSLEGAGSGFPALVDELIAFPKPLVCAVNGLALGIGATMLGLADLVLMASDARVRCPFTALAVAPEAASSVTFPMLMGRQAATWALLSSEWLTAEECLRAGLAWKVCPPESLLDEASAVARLLAAKPLASLVETKATIVAGLRDAVAAARAREDAAYQRLLGTPANLEAFAALAERRDPDFARIDAEHPPAL